MRRIFLNEMDPRHRLLGQRWPPTDEVDQPFIGEDRTWLSLQEQLGHIAHRELFEAVQRRLTDQRTHHVMTRTKSDAPLKGILFDAAGDPMVATHATKQGVRYRYYVSQPYLRGLATPLMGAIVRVPAPDIEAVVTNALSEYLARSNTAAAQASSADQPSIRAMVARIEVRNSHLALWLMHPGQE